MALSSAHSTTLTLTGLAGTDTPRSRDAQFCTLPDGRRLAYSEYGDPQGSPVLYLHDGGSSRLEAGLFHEQARSAGLRLIAMDRPGVGQSDFVAITRPMDCCGDLLGLAKHLGVERFGLLSFGAGGIYGLALSRYFPHRISTHVSLGGVPGNVFRENPARSSLGHCFDGLTPTLVKCLVRFKHHLFPEEPQQNIDRLKSHLSYTDRKLLQHKGFTRRLVRDQQEALQGGYRGVAQDIALGFRKLDFGLSEVSVPTLIWQGAADLLSQRGDCEFLAARLPRARLQRVPNLGHFFFMHRMHEVLAGLSPSQAGSDNPSLAA